LFWSSGRAVDIVTAYGMDDREVSRALPASYPVDSGMGGGEADHLPPTSAKVNEASIYAFTPRNVLMAKGQLYLSVRELTIPTERPLQPANLVPTFADRGSCVVDATDPYDR
jgi:hypothetical protein